MNKKKDLKNYVNLKGMKFIKYIEKNEFQQKILCSKCNKIMGGESSTSHTGEEHIYYKCNCCKKRISKKKIEKEEYTLTDEAPHVRKVVLK